MFEKFYRFIQMKLTYAIISLLQSSFVKNAIHTYKYITNTLYIGEYSVNEFKNTWKVICMKKCPKNSIYYYVIDPTTPLEEITEDIVYTMKDIEGHVKYFPIFVDEINKICRVYKHDDVNYITLYTVLRWRIDNQIADYNPISRMYENLFDKDDQYFIPYMQDNKYINSLHHMYDIGAIY